MDIRPLEKKKNVNLAPKLILLTVLLSIGLLAHIVTKNMKKNKAGSVNLSEAQIVHANPIDDMTKVAAGFSQQTGNSIGSVLGIATEAARDTVSKSSAMVSQFIYDNTFGKLVDQIKNLPSDQQQKVKAQICK